jgi:hypothetical protein
LCIGAVGGELAFGDRHGVVGGSFSSLADARGSVSTM